jgi:all-trans-retinol 13,14-reductase
VGRNRHWFRHRRVDRCGTAVSYGGKRVLVLERLYVAGGFTHSFHRPGYEWDVELHYIGQVRDKQSAVRRAFDHITDGAALWNALPEVYDRAVIDGRSFDLAAGIERFREGMKQYFPRESKSIDKYIRMVRAINRVSGLYYAEKVIPAPAAGPLSDRIFEEGKNSRSPHER